MAESFHVERVQSAVWGGQEVLGSRVSPGRVAVCQLLPVPIVELCQIALQVGDQGA